MPTTIQSRIESEILLVLDIPPNFLRMEVRPVGKNAYRANVVCSKQTKGSVFPTIYRPYSYYVTVDGDNLGFNPPLGG